jgi:hypothetical protein
VPVADGAACRPRGIAQTRIANDTERPARWPVQGRLTAADRASRLPSAVPVIRTSPSSLQPLIWSIWRPMSAILSHSSSIHPRQGRAKTAPMEQPVGRRVSWPPGCSSSSMPVFLQSLDEPEDQLLGGDRSASPRSSSAAWRRSDLSGLFAAQQRHLFAPVCVHQRISPGL